MIFLVGLLTLLAITHAGGDHHLKGGSRIKGGTALSLQEKVSQEDIPPPPFVIKTAASSYGTKIGAGDADGRVKGTRGTPMTVQQLADDSLQPSEPSIKTLSSADAQIKTAPKIDPAPALHHAVKTLSEKSGKRQPSPGMHHAASRPVVQDQVRIDDPVSIRGIQSLKTAPASKTAFMSGDTQVREPIARPVVQTVKTVEDPSSGSVKGVKTVKAITPTGKTHFSLQDTERRDPTARPVLPSVKTMADPNVEASKGLKTVKTAPSEKTHFSSQDTQVRDPIARPVTQSVKTVTDLVTPRNSVKTLGRTADASSRTKTVKSAVKILQQSIDSQSISSVPESIVETSRRSNLGAISFSAGQSRPESQRIPSQTQGRQQAMVLSNAGLQIGSNSGISGGSAAITLDEEMIKRLQNAGGIVDNSGEIVVNNEGMKIFQNAGISSFTQPLDTPLRAPTVLAASAAARGQSPNGDRRPTVMRGTDLFHKPETLAAQPLLRTIGSRGSQPTTRIRTSGITGDVRLQPTRGMQGGLLTSTAAGSTAGLLSAGGVSRSSTESRTAGEIQRIRSAGAAAGGLAGMRLSGIVSGAPARRQPEGEIGQGSGSTVAGGTAGLRLQGEVPGARTRVRPAAGTTGLRLSGGVSRTAAGQMQSGAPVSGRAGLHTLGEISRTGLRQASAVSDTSGLRLAGGVSSSTTGLRSTGETSREIAGMAAEITDAERQRTGGRMKYEGLVGSGAITLNEETLRAIQSVGGTVNPNGEITLNDESMKILRLGSGIPEPVTEMGTTGAVAREISRTTVGLRPEAGIGGVRPLAGRERLRTAGEIPGRRGEMRAGGVAASEISRGATEIKPAGGATGGTGILRVAYAAPGGISRATTGLRPSDGAAAGTGLRAVGRVPGSTRTGGVMTGPAGAAARGMSRVTTGARPEGGVGVRTTGGIPGALIGSVRASSRATAGLRETGGAAGGTVLRSTGGVPGTIARPAGAAAIGISRATTGLRHAGGAAGGTRLRSTGGVPGVMTRPEEAAGVGIPRATTGLRPVGGAVAGTDLRAGSGVPGQLAGSTGTTAGGISILTTGRQPAGGASSGTGLRLSSGVPAAMIGVRPGSTAVGGIPGLRIASGVSRQNTGVAAGQRLSGGLQATIPRVRPSTESTSGTVGLRLAGGVPEAVPAMKPVDVAAGGMTGLHSAGGVLRTTTGLRSSSASAGGTTGLRLAGDISGAPIRQRPASISTGRITDLRRTGGISRATGELPKSAAVSGATGLTLAAGISSAMAGLQPADVSASRKPGMKLESGTAGAMAGLHPSGETSGVFGGLRKAGVTADITGAGVHRTGATTGDIINFGGAIGSGAITLNSETLRAIQSVGGTVNANGEITLNDAGMKILQNTGGMSSGQQARTSLSSLDISTENKIQKQRINVGILPEVQRSKNELRISESPAMKPLLRTTSRQSIDHVRRVSTHENTRQQLGLISSEGPQDQSGVQTISFGTTGVEGLRSTVDTRESTGQGNTRDKSRVTGGQKPETAGQRETSGLRAGTAAIGTTGGTLGSRVTQGSSGLRTVEGLGISHMTGAGVSGASTGLRGVKPVTRTLQLSEASLGGRTSGMRMGTIAGGALRSTTGAGITRGPGNMGSGRDAPQVIASGGTAGLRTSTTEFRTGGTFGTRGAIGTLGLRRGTARLPTIQATETAVGGGSARLTAGTTGYGIRGIAGTTGILSGTGSAAGLRTGIVGMEAARATGSGSRITGTGEINLNQETLKAIQKVGGIANEKGEIILNEEAMKILQKSGGTSQIQRSPVSFSVPTSLNKNVASQMTGPGRSDATTGASLKPHPAYIKPLIRGTGNIHRQPAGDYSRRISTGEPTSRQQHANPEIHSITDFGRVGGTGARPSLRTTGSAQQQAGRVSLDINRSASAEKLSSQPETASNTNKVFFNGKEISINEVRAGQIFDENLQPILSGMDKPTEETLFTAPQGIQSGTQPSLSSTVSSRSRSAIRSSIKPVPGGAPQDLRMRGPIPEPSGGILTPNAPNTAGIRVPGSVEFPASSGATTIVFNGKEINISGLQAGQIFDENLQPITSNSDSLRIPSEALSQPSPGRDTMITGSISPQISPAPLSVTRSQSLRHSSVGAQQGGLSSQRSAQVSSRSRIDLPRVRQTGSARLPVSAVPQRSSAEMNTRLRSTGMLATDKERSGSITSSTSATSAALRTANRLRSPNTVSSQGSATLEAQTFGFNSQETGSRIPMMTLSSSGGRTAPVPNQRSRAAGLRVPESSTHERIRGPADYLSVSRSGMASIQRSSGSEIRHGSVQSQDFGLRSSQPVGSSSDIPSGLAGTANSLASGTIVFNGKEVNIDGLQAGQIFDENLHPVLSGTSSSVGGIAALHGNLSPETPRRDLSQNNRIGAFRGTGAIDQTGASTSLHRSSGLQRLNQEGAISTYASVDNSNTGLNARRVPQNRITQEVAQDQIETRVIQQNQDPLLLFQDKVVPEQQIVQEQVSLKVPSESPFVKVPSVQLSQKALDPTENMPTQLRVEDVVEQRPESKLSDTRTVQVQEKVPAFTKVTQISQKDIDIPIAQQRVMESDFLPKRSFLAPFNYGIPQIQYIKTGRRTPITQEQQMVEQIFV